jgi:hypothetical protein
MTIEYLYRNFPSCVSANHLRLEPAPCTGFKLLWVRFPHHFSAGGSGQNGPLLGALKAAQNSYTKEISVSGLAMIREGLLISAASTYSD